MGFLRKLPIRCQLLILAVSTVLIVFIIISTTYFRVSKVICKKSSEYTNEMVLQIKKNVSSNSEDLDRVITNIAYNLVVQDFLIESDPLKKYELYNKVENIMDNMQSMKDGILDIVIISDNGTQYGTVEGVRLLEEVKHYIPERVASYYTGTRIFELEDQKYNCIIAGTTMFSIDPTKMPNKRIGTLALIIDTEAICPVTSVIPETSSTKYYLTDRENKIYLSNDALAIGGSSEAISSLEINHNKPVLSKINGKKYIIQIENTPEIGGKVVSIIPEKELFSDLVIVRQLAVIMFACALFLLSIPFVIIINNIVQPLRKFMCFMNNLKSGNLNNLKNRICLQGYSEMSIMANEFNSMLDKIDNLTNNLLQTNSKLYQSEIEKKKSELAFLQSQINPHFLYNTLESIKGIAIVRGVYEIRDITKALGQILCYSIKKENIVSLSEELDIIQFYVQIQQIRFKNRFSVTYEFSENALECKVIRMFLQPIVENAIYHGLEPKLEKGNLYIGGRIREDNELEIWVKDDGIGINRDKLLKIHEELEETCCSEIGGKKKIGIGLSNVNNRIGLTFGAHYGLAIKSSCNQGTEVVLNLPARRNACV